MGLAVAYELCLLGHKPIIFEADNRVGGMTACFDFDGVDIERFYHFHCTSDVDFFQILTELGLRDKLHWRKTKMGFYLNGKLNPWGNPLALFKLPGIGLVSKLRYGLHAFIATKRKGWGKLDQISATHWIRKWIGEEAFKILWMPLFHYKFYEYSDRVSAAWIWSRIRRIGKSRYNLFEEKLGYLEGGSKTFLDAISASIEQRGGLLKLNKKVQAIEIRNKKLIGLKVDDEILEFDTVISTIPVPLLPTIAPNLPSKIMEFCKNQTNLSVVCVIMKLKKKVSNNFWVNINDEHMDIPGLVEYSNLTQGEENIVYIPFYMPQSNEKFKDDDKTFILKCRQYIKKINPSFCETDFISERVNRYLFSQPVCETSFARQIPSFQTAIKGLYIADTTYYYPEDRGISESVCLGRKLAKIAEKSF